MRLVPVSKKVAWFWHRWVARLIGTAAIGWQTILTLRALGMPQAGNEVLVQLLLLALTCLGIVIVWSMPRASERCGAADARPGPAPAGVARPAARLAAVPDGRICARLDTADPCRGADCDLRSRPIRSVTVMTRPGAGTGCPSSQPYRAIGERSDPGDGRADCRRDIGACMADRHDGDVRHGHADDAHRARPARGVGDPGDRRPAVAGGARDDRPAAGRRGFAGRRAGR